MPQEILRRVLTVPVYDVAVESPLELAPLISKKVQNKIWLSAKTFSLCFRLN